MTMHAVPKTIFDRSLKLARAPIDAALGLMGATDSPVRHLLDRVEAGARGGAGVLFADEELRQQGRESLLATRQRERAAGLHEEAELREDAAMRNLQEAGEEAAEAKAEAQRQAEAERRKADKRQRERGARAAKSAAARKEKTAKSAAQAKRDNAKRDRVARLEKLDAKKESIDAKEAAVRAEREAARLKKATSAAKGARKNGRD